METLKILNETTLPFNVNLERFTVIDNDIYFIDIDINNSYGLSIPILYKYNIEKDTVTKLPELDFSSSMGLYGFMVNDIKDISVFKWKNNENMRNNSHYGIDNATLCVAISTGFSQLLNYTHLWKFVNNKWEYVTSSAYGLESNVMSLISGYRCGNIYNKLIDLWRWKEVPRISLNDDGVPQLLTSISHNDLMDGGLCFNLCKIKDNNSYSLLCEYDGKFTIFSPYNWVYVAELCGPNENTTEESDDDEPVIAGTEAFSNCKDDKPALEDATSIIDGKFSHVLTMPTEPNIEHITCIDNDLYFLDIHDNKFPRNAYRLSIDKNEIETLPRIPYTVARLKEEDVEVDGYFVKENSDICIIMKIDGDIPDDSTESDKRYRHIRYYNKYILSTDINENPIWRDVTLEYEPHTLQQLYEKGATDTLYNQIAIRMNYSDYILQISNVDLKRNMNDDKSFYDSIKILKNEQECFNRDDIGFGFIKLPTNKVYFKVYSVKMLEISGIYCIWKNKIVSIINNYNDIQIFDIIDKDENVKDSDDASEGNTENNVLEPEYLLNQLEMKRVNDIPIKIGFYLESVLWYEKANRINMEIQELLKAIGKYGSLVCFTNLQLTPEDAAKLIAYFNKNNIKCSDIFCISENKLCSENYDGNGMSNWIDCDVILNAKSGLTQTFNTLKSFVDLNENTENNVLEPEYHTMKSSGELDFDGDVFCVINIEEYNKEKTEDDVNKTPNDSKEIRVFPSEFEIGKFYRTMKSNPRFTSTIDYLHIIQRIKTESNGDKKVLIAENHMGKLIQINEESFEQFIEITKDEWDKKREF